MDGRKKYATVATFAAPEHGFVVGQLRTRSWQTLELITQEDVDKPTERGMVWLKRADQYWERQMRKFGIVVGNGVVMVDVIDGKTIITTAAPVLAVMPGDRI